MEKSGKTRFKPLSTSSIRLVKKILVIAEVVIFLYLTIFFLTSCTKAKISPPVLPSARVMYLDGVRGLWIDEADTANLLLYINNATL